MIHLSIRGVFYTSSKIEEQTDLMSFRTESGQNKVRLEFVSGIRNSLPKRTFQKKFALAGKHLRTTIGPW